MSGSVTHRDVFEHAGYECWVEHGTGECEVIEYGNYAGESWWQAFVYAHKDVDVSECAPDRGLIAVLRTAGPDMRRYRLGRNNVSKFPDSVSAIIAVTDFAQRAAEKNR